MSAPPLATIADLAGWLKLPIESGDARAESALVFASSLVPRRAGKNWLNDAGDALATDIPDGIKQVTEMVAGRLYKNPTGDSQATTGPFATTFGGNALTAAEEQIIDAAIGATPIRGLGTITTTRSDCDGPVLIDVIGGQPMPVDLPLGLPGGGGTYPVPARRVDW